MLDSYLMMALLVVDIPKEEVDAILELVREEEKLKVRRIKLLGLDKFSMLADKYK